MWDGRETTTLQLTSPVRGMHIVEDVQSDMDSGIVGAASEMDNASTGQYSYTNNNVYTVHVYVALCALIALYMYVHVHVLPCMFLWVFFLFLLGKELHV